jgi:hypothetical protein
MAAVIKPIAFYLPQFHPTRINDVNWAPGFTEWLNVAKAKPLFDGHYQPRLPGALGFYDLRCPEVLCEQAGLARQYGFYGFCFYYYRFGDQRVLNRPLDDFLKHPIPDIPFMYCWANENWTRAWDGRSDNLLLQQTYGEDTIVGLVRDLVSAMRDRRYIHVAGRPFFLIYQIELLPEPSAWIGRLRDAVFAELGEEITIGGVFSHGFRPAMLKSVDVIVQFPPHRTPRSGPRELLGPDQISPYDPSRKDFFEAYDSVVETAMAGVSVIGPMYPTVMPDWDNSPRRPRSAHVVVGSSPALFERWVARAGRAALRKFATRDLPAPLLFVNAWNEWGEGAAMEPSHTIGTAYLDAFRAGFESAHMDEPKAETVAMRAAEAKPQGLSISFVKQAR